MLIISHRGFWTQPSEKNTLGAFRRTVDAGFGSETDFRDLDGKLVVSHDPPTALTAIDAVKTMELFKSKGLVLAVNVKSDGIAILIKDLMDAYDQEYFAFDMSGPQQKQYQLLGVPTFTRHSDIEQVPILYDGAAGIWLDDFQGEWHSEKIIREHLAAGKKVAVVSPELHGRSETTVWNMLKETGLDRANGLILCTDFPDKASTHFGSR